jgi:hypothetical protein
VQDFGGFRVIVLLPRFKPGWVAPGTYQEELPRKEGELGAPKSALPVIMPNGKPICSATIRAGPGYLEVPFFATQETRRRKGYGRGLLQVHAALLRVSCFDVQVNRADALCLSRSRLKRSRAA